LTEKIVTEAASRPWRHIESCYKSTLQWKRGISMCTP